jgi:hypothetical protein
MRGLGRRLRLLFASLPFLTSFDLLLFRFVSFDTDYKPDSRSNVNTNYIGIDMVVYNINIDSMFVANARLLCLELLQSLETKFSSLD